MMGKNILMLAIGLFIGLALMSFIKNRQKVELQTKYVELQEDFSLGNGGVLKKGTMLKVDKPASEGYTRYILFINYKSDVGIEVKSYNEDNLVKPYWLYRSDSLPIKSN